MELNYIDGISYQLLDKDNIDEVIHLVSDHFVRTEYLTRESGLSYAEFAQLVSAYCEVTLIEKLSIIAKEGNKIVGFAISEDPKSIQAVDANQFISLSPKFEPFFNVLEDLNHSGIDFEIKGGDCFHLFLLGVLPDYQGRRIGKNLVKVSEELAKKRKFSYILIEATSPLTKPLCDSLDYTTIAQLPYSSYEFKGTKPFAHLKDYDSPYLVIKFFNL